MINFPSPFISGQYLQDFRIQHKRYVLWSGPLFRDFYFRVSEKGTYGGTSRFPILHVPETYGQAKF